MLSNWWYMPGTNINAMASVVSFCILGYHVLDNYHAIVHATNLNTSLIFSVGKVDTTDKPNNIDNVLTRFNLHPGYDD